MTSFNNRNCSMDILRIISMFLIVLLHINGHGDIQSSTEPFSSQWSMLTLLRSFALVGVNCFAMITGFFGYKQKFDINRIIKLYIKVLFYSIMITITFSIMLPGSVSVKTWLNSIFPLFRGHYWYISAYVGMFFFIPFLNKVVEKLSYQEFKRYALFLFCFFSLIPTIMVSDPFALHFGHSSFWLMIMYIVGGCLAKHNINHKLSSKQWLTIFFSIAILNTIAVECIARITSIFFGVAKLPKILLCYTSPTILFESIALLLFFSKIEIHNVNVSRITTFLSVRSLPVYLIHDHSLVRYFFIKDILPPYIINPNINGGVLLVKIIFAGIIIYITCSLIELIREKIFKLNNIHRFVYHLLCRCNLL